jgi:hypothetical protein
MNTKGCKITKLTNEKELHFTWKGPDQFETLMNKENELTNVHVSFITIDDDTTKVIVNHIGFKEMRTGSKQLSGTKWLGQVFLIV